MARFKKILSLDFDGVIHAYTSGWQGPDVIPDPPVPGALAFIRRFADALCDQPASPGRTARQGTWELAVFSSRSRYPHAIKAMKDWLARNGLEPDYLEIILFPSEKPLATLTIDDRCLCFDGTWPELAAVTGFQPWYRRRKKGVRPVARVPGGRAPKKGT